jgi:RNA polymerase sigma factor (sigma-70 family)
MPSPPLLTVLRRLRRTADTTAGPSDAELLARFAADRDEAAFELLIWRHGPMVLGVCRRWLGDLHAAEDAFQATFLALARRARSIRRHASVAGWLYRVAGRVALAVRERSNRRATLEQPMNGYAPPSRDPEPPTAAALQELSQGLDIAIARLPARYREPLLLTCFGGRSHAEAARELGCAVRTVESRLGRARQRLRAALLRRGLLPAGGLATVLSAANAPASVGASLVAATVRANIRGSASIPIETLTQGVLHAMFLSKLKVAGVVVFAAGFIGLGAGGWVYQSRAVGQAPANAPAVAQNPGTPANKQDRKQRVQELLRELTEALNDDASDDVTQPLQELLKKARDRRVRQSERDKLIAAQLQIIHTALAKMRDAATGDLDREKAVAAFDVDVTRLRERLNLPGVAVQFHDVANPLFMRFAQARQLTDLRGKVKRVEGELAVVNLGSDNGIEVGQMLSIYRDEATAVYVAQIRVLAVAPTEAVGQLMGRTKYPVEANDHVAPTRAQTR